MKDLLKQYASTGIDINEYQFNKLSHNLKGTYIRTRMVGVREGNIEFSEHELDYLPKLPNLYKEYLISGSPVSKAQMLQLDDEQLKGYLLGRMKKNEEAPEYSDINNYEIRMFPILGDENNETSIYQMLYLYEDLINNEDVGYPTSYDIKKANELVDDMLRYMSEGMIKSIFSTLGNYLGHDYLPKYNSEDKFSVLAHKYGSIEDDRKTIEDIVEIVLIRNHYEDKGSYIDAHEDTDDIYFYTDSTMENDSNMLNNEHINDLSMKELIKVIRDRAPKVFDLKDE